MLYRLTVINFTWELVLSNALYSAPSSILFLYSRPNIEDLTLRLLFVSRGSLSSAEDCLLRIRSLRRSFTAIYQAIDIDRIPLLSLNNTVAFFSVSSPLNMDYRCFPTWVVPDDYHSAISRLNTRPVAQRAILPF